MNRIISVTAFKLFLFAFSFLWMSASVNAATCENHFNSVPANGSSANSGTNWGNVQAHYHYNWACGASTRVEATGGCSINGNGTSSASAGGGCGSSTTDVNVQMNTSAVTQCRVYMYASSDTCSTASETRYIKVNQVVAITGAPAATQPVGTVSTALNYTATNHNGVNTKAIAGNTGTWSTSGTNGCYMSGSTVFYGKVPGTCTVTMTVSGTTNDLVGNSAAFTTTLTQTAQTMTVTTPAPAGPVAYGATFNVAATTNGYPAVISTGLGGSCMASSTGVGTALITITSTSAPCVVYYNQDGLNASGYAVYSAVAQQSNTTTITVAKINQTITFGGQTAQIYAPGATFPINPKATASSGFAVTYSTTTPGVCTLTGISNDVVAIQAVGTCTIKADQAGNANYNAAPQGSQNITISKAAQTITVTQAAPATAEAGSTFPVAATSSSGLPVAITASGSCTAPGGATASTTITVGAVVGTCNVFFNQAGNGNYNAATQVSNATSVTLLMQTINVTQPAPSQVALSSFFDVTASASSGLSVAITVTGGCVVNSGGSNSAHIQLTSGTVPCIVKFNQAGNVAYGPATEVTNTVVAIRTAQSITVTTAPPLSAASGVSFNVAASVAPSPLNVTITVSGGCIITVGGTSTATIQMNSGLAACNVNFNQAGNDSYSPAAQVTSIVKDATAPVIAQVTAVPTPTNQTPEYTFSSTETGTIVYGGPCSSGTTSAVIGNNTVVFNQLAVATYTTCTIKVVDATGNQSGVLTLPSFTVQANVIAYVKPVASGTGDCSSWVNACANIQTAINSPGVNEVWITAGVYKPASTIVLKAGVGLYGGFAGNETSYVPSYINTTMNVENGVVSAGATYGTTSNATNLTIISGDKDNNDIIDSRGLVLFAADVKGTNLTQLMSATNLTVSDTKRVKISNLIFNGARGTANGAAIGIVNSYVEVDRTQFVFNKGGTGGAVSVTTDGKFTAIDSVFLGNESTAAGGAVASTGASTSNNVVLLQNDIFESNVGGTNGGAVEHSAGKLWLLNSTFFGNSLLSTTGSGGGVNLASLTYPSSADIRYTTFVKNIAGTAASPNGRGGAISINSAANAVATLANSLIVSNSASATAGSNIADMAKISDGGYNIVGFNGISGMVTGVNTPYDFTGGTSVTAPTVLVTDIVDIALANNGGYTATLKLKETSYARDRIPNIHADCEKVTSIGEDQRGSVRPNVEGNYCDVGAMELDNIDPCTDPNRQQGFFIMTYPSKTCIANGGLSVSVGSIHPFYLILLSLVGIVLSIKQRKVKLIQS